MMKKIILCLFLYSLFGEHHVQSGSLAIKKCHEAVSDVLFVLDSSTSVGPYNWKLLLNFVVNLVRPFGIGSAKTKVGVITFNTAVKHPIHINNKMTKDALISKIFKLPYSEGLTFMGEALTLAQSVLKNDNRKDCVKLIILVTDGVANGAIEPIKVANALKRHKVKIMTVGVTNHVDKKQLEAISTSGHMETVSHFKELEGHVFEIIRKKVCVEVITKICRRQKSDVTFILDSSISISQDHWDQTVQFAERLTGPLFIGKNAGRVALMTFSTKQKLEFLFDKYLDKVDLLKKGLSGVQYRKGLTFMGEALQFFEKNIYPKMRKGVAKIVILITDGHPNGDVNPLKEAAKLKKKGVILLTVGVTPDINKQYLRKISSDHKVYGTVLFSDLSSILKKVQGQICRHIK